MASYLVLVDTRWHPGDCRAGTVFRSFSLLPLHSYVLTGTDDGVRRLQCADVDARVNIWEQWRFWTC